MWNNLTMKCEIEVVGERCGRKNEPRPFISCAFSPSPPPHSHASPHQGTVSPEDLTEGRAREKHPNASGRRTACTPHPVFLWRRPAFYGSQGLAGRGMMDQQGPISQEQLGLKVRISYVDCKGQVNPSPKFSRPARTLTTLEAEKGCVDLPLHAQDEVCGWGPSVSTHSLPGRLYRSRTMTSTRDKILSSALDKHFVEHPGFSPTGQGQPFPSSSTTTTATSMPSIPTSRSRLTTSTPSTSPPPSILPKASGSDSGNSSSLFRAGCGSNSISNTSLPTASNPGDCASIPPIKPILKGSRPHGKEPTAMNGIGTNEAGIMTSKGTVGAAADDIQTATTIRPHSKGSTVLNGIHAKGKGPTSWAIMNGVHSAQGKNPSGPAREGVHVSPYGRLQRSFTEVPSKRVHFDLSTMLKEHMRSMYQQRRALSAARDGWSGPSGSVAVACSRLKHRRRTTMVAPQSSAEVDRDVNAPPPVSRMFRKFRMVASITVTLIRLKAAIVVNSMDRTERSAAEIQWRTLYGQQEAEKLAFSKSYYSRERISTKMPRWALEIFDVPPERRTEGDCRRLHALFRGMRSFDKFTEEIQLNLCRAVTYTCIEETRIVLRRGHIGHNFYFIYSGSVFVNVQDIDSDGEPFIKTEAILAHGDSFGELALLKDIRRTATVSVRETCELLVVEKDVFSQVCPMIFEKELQEKKSFISRMPLFTSKFWNADVLSSLCMEAQIQEYKINKIVVENSTTEEWLYICMEGQCQVIRCLSEEGEEEEEEEGEEEKKKKKDKRKRGRKQSVILSEEIIELLAAASAAAKDGQERPDEETSQEKLLSSLGLEYVNTGKRSGPFLEEVEAEGRRKWLQASSGPMTLTSLMARQEKSGLVFIKVGNLEAEDIFDIGSLLKKPAPRTHSALLLVSCGARLLRLKKSLFHRLASPQALEHAKTVISRHPFPTDTAIVDSYRNKVTWDAYKSQVVHGVVRARDLRTAPKFRAYDSKDRAEPQPPQPPGPDRSKSSTNLKSAAEEAKGSTTHKQKGGVTFEEVDKNSAGVGDDGEEEDNTQSSAQDPREPVQQSNRECGLEAIAEDDDDMQTQDDATDPPGSTHRQEQQQRRTFPIMEVDTNPDPGTPRPTSSSSSATAQDLPPMQPPVPLSLLRDAGPAPEAVIIRRKSSIHPNFRPSGVSVDTTFVTRRHRSRDESSSRAPPTTRFKVASDLDPTAVAEKA